MNSNFIAGVLSKVPNVLTAPGCLDDVVMRPNGSREAIGIVAVLEHRFAFRYWLHWAAERPESREPPDLLTIDWHDDVGGTCDFTPRTLKRLNAKDENELSIFTWAGLRSINDGHIAPAMYLDAVRNVYVLMKQKNGFKDGEEYERHQKLTDMNGVVHHVRYFSTSEIPRLVETLEQQTRDLVLDIDLDFFTKYKGEDFPSETPERVSPASIRRFLTGPLIEAALARVRYGITIALEPEYCGGLINCMKLLETLNHTWFDGQLFGGADVKWKHLGSKN